MRAHENFDKLTIGPKFELSDDPQHELSVDDIDKQVERRRYSTIWDHRPLRRIRALRDFGDVKKGDLGGYLQDPSFLDHAGTCWIYDDACVLASNAPMNGVPLACKPTYLTGDAKLYDQAMFTGGVIEGQAVVRGTVCCFNVHLSGDTELYPKVLPYVVSGKIHNDRADETAQNYLDIADGEDINCGGVTDGQQAWAIFVSQCRYARKFVLRLAR